MRAGETDPGVADSVGDLQYDIHQRYVYLRAALRGWAERRSVGRTVRVLDVGSGASRLTGQYLGDGFEVTRSDVGDFDEDYFCYLEDMDLGMRGQLAGWQCWYVPDSRVSHRKSAAFGNYSEFKAYHVERNRIYNAVKLLPRFILLMSPLFTLNRYLLQGYAAVTHRGLSDEFVKEYSYPRLAWLLLRAYTAALWKLPRMLRKRHEISQSRRITTDEWYRLISRFKLDAIELALKY